MVEVVLYFMTDKIDISSNPAKVSDILFSKTKSDTGDTGREPYKGLP